MVRGIVHPCVVAAVAALFISGAFALLPGTGLPTPHLWLCTPEFCQGGVCVAADSCSGVGQEQRWPAEIVQGTGVPESPGGDPSRPLCCVEMPNNCAKAHNGTCMAMDACPYRAIPGGAGLCRDVDRTLGWGCCTSKGGPKPPDASPEPTATATSAATPEPTPAPWPVVDRTCVGHDRCEALHRGLCMFAANCPLTPISGNGLCEGAAAQNGIACCPLGNGRGSTQNAALTAAEASHLLSERAANVSLESTFQCNWRAPGCTSLEGVREHVVFAMASLFPRNGGCAVTIVAGTEFGADDGGLDAHQQGYALGLKASACVNAVAEAGAPLDVPRNADRCQRELTRPGQWWCHLHAGNTWDVVFTEPAAALVDATREPNNAQDSTIDACINLVNEMEDPKWGRRVFDDDYGFLARHARACGDNICLLPGAPLNPDPRTTPRSGGVFGISREVFEVALGWACDCGNEEIVAAVNAFLGTENFCSLDYRAADSCVVSALAVRLFLRAKQLSIPDREPLQEALFVQHFSPGGAAQRCNATFFLQVPECRPPPPQREVCRLRIGIVLDESGSIGRVNYFNTVSAIRAFLTSGSLSNASEVALVTYAAQARLIYDFVDPPTANENMENMNYAARGTATHAGMELMLAQFPPAAQQTAVDHSVLLVITDGQTNNAALLRQTTSTYVQRFGHITPFAIGIADYRMSELLEITQERSERVMVLTTFDAFVTNLKTMMQRVCRESSDAQSALVNATAVADNDSPPTFSLPLNLSSSEVRYLKLNVSSRIQILSLRARSTSGCLTVYLSTRMRNPSAAVHDAVLRCSDTSETTFPVLRSRRKRGPKQWLPTVEGAARVMQALEHGSDGEEDQEDVDPSSDAITLYMGIHADGAVAASEGTIMFADRRALTRTATHSDTSEPPTSPPTPTTTTPTRAGDVDDSSQASSAAHDAESLTSSLASSSPLPPPPSTTTAAPSSSSETAAPPTATEPSPPRDGSDADSDHLPQREVPADTSRDSSCDVSCMTLLALGIAICGGTCAIFFLVARSLAKTVLRDEETVSDGDEEDQANEKDEASEGGMEVSENSGTANTAEPFDDLPAQPAGFGVAQRQPGARRSKQRPPPTEPIYENPVRHL